VGGEEQNAPINPEQKTRRNPLASGNGQTPEGAKVRDVGKKNKTKSKALDRSGSDIWGARLGPGTPTKKTEGGQKKPVVRQNRSNRLRKKW